MTTSKIEMIKNANVMLDQEFLNKEAADWLMNTISAGVNFRPDQVIVDKQVIDTPHKAAWFGKPFMSNGLKTRSAPLTKVLHQIMRRIEAHMDIPEGYFNSVEIRKMNQFDSIGWTSATEHAELGSNPRVIELSLGVQRTMQFRSKDGGALISTELMHGSLLVMGKDSQRLYNYHMPRQMTRAGIRIGLTFRHVVDNKPQPPKAPDLPPAQDDTSFLNEFAAPAEPTVPDVPVVPAAPVVEAPVASSISVGDMIHYKDKNMLVWNIKADGKMQLGCIEDGKWIKFAGTPNNKKYIAMGGTSTGAYPVAVYNNTSYIIVATDMIISSASGNHVYAGDTETDIKHRELIIGALK